MERPPADPEPRLDRRLRRPGLTLVAPLLLLGLAGTVTAVKDRESDTGFIFGQQDLSPVQAGALERFVTSAPDPRPGLHGRRGLSAVCTPGGTGEGRNPWRCVVRYPVQGSVTYRVVIDPSGHVRGADRSGQLIVYGCCVGPRPSG